MNFRDNPFALSLLKGELFLVAPFMVRQAHHERTFWNVTLCPRKMPTTRTSLKLFRMRKELQHDTVEIGPVAMAAGSLTIQRWAIRRTTLIDKTASLH
jgi:hypothetical protein